MRFRPLKVRIADDAVAAADARETRSLPGPQDPATPPWGGAGAAMPAVGEAAPAVVDAAEGIGVSGAVDGGDSAPVPAAPVDTIPPPTGAPAEAET